MKKIAIVLCGISYKENYNHWKGGTVCIDYKNSIDNYNEYLFDYFKKLGYNIDIYLSTNNVNETIKKDILEKYKPIKYNFLIDAEDSFSSKDAGWNEKQCFKPKQKKNIIGIELLKGYCQNKKKPYDLVLFTRFDLLFNIFFHEKYVNIDINAMNIISKIDNGFVCDNFFLFPYKLLDIFEKSIRAKDFNHDIDKFFNRYNITINFIYNQPCNPFVHQLEFYTIFNSIINKEQGLLINKFHGNKIFMLRNKILVNIHRERIFVKKSSTSKEPFLWVGFNISDNVPGDLSFEIKFNSTIPPVNSGFGVKQHGRDILHSEWLTDCKKNIYNKVSINLISPRSDLIIFIMDQYEPILDFEIRNLEMKFSVL